MTVNVANPASAGSGRETSSYVRLRSHGVTLARTARASHSMHWARRFAREKSGMAGLLILATLAFLAIAAPWVAPHDPVTVDPRAMLASSSQQHPLGTDNLGRDLLSRLIWGGRWSLGIALVAGLIIAGIGTLVGIVSGFVGGRLDEVLMRIVDVLLAFPSLVLALAIVGTVGPGTINVMLGMAAVWWADYARVVRAATLRARADTYVEAAQSCGCPPWRVLTRHVFPNVLPSVIVLATFGFGGLILALSGLGFLGLGAQPPIPEWGTMLDDGRPFFQRAPQLMIYPGLAIACSALGCNLVGMPCVTCSIHGYGGEPVVVLRIPVRDWSGPPIYNHRRKNSMTVSTNHSRVTRRTLLQASGLALATTGVALAGRAPLSVQARQEASVLRVGATGDRNITEPPLPNVGMSIPNPNIFETLIMLDGDFQLQPGLAESWELVEPNTWRFKLREGVTFHDGTPFTAEAVEWTMKRVAKSGGGVLGVDENSTKIIDDYTVEITPITQNLRLPLQMSGPRTGSIIAPGTNPGEVRIGTGPFREVEYVPEEHHLVEKFADYWGEPAKVDQIDFRFLPDPTTRLLALEAGEVDLIYDVPRDAAPGLRDGGTFDLAVSGVGAYQALAFNIHGDAPYELGQDPIVREAVAMAIDKQIIADAAWQGFAVVDNGMIPASVLGSAEADITQVPFDPEAARQLLEDAGWVAGGDGIREKDGRRLQLELITGYPTAEIQGTAPELVQAQLLEIGAEMTITQINDSGTYNDRLVERAGDLWMEVGNQVDADPCYLPALLYVSPDPDLDVELNSYSNAFAPGAEFDAAIAECGETATQEGVQEAAAKAMNVMISQHIVMPLVGIQRIYAHSPQVEGFVAHPVQFLQRWEDVSLAGA